jgi:hypothetical protein
MGLLMGFFRNLKLSHRDYETLVQPVPVIGADIPQQDEEVKLEESEFFWWASSPGRSGPFTNQSFTQLERAGGPREGESSDKYLARLRGTDKISTTLTEPTRESPSVSTEIAALRESVLRELDRLAKRAIAFERHSDE